MISMSIVVATLTAAFVPSGRMKPSSGEPEGAVTRWPWPSSMSQSRQNSAEPFMMGHAVSRRNFLSPLNA